MDKRDLDQLAGVIDPRDAFRKGKGGVGPAFGIKKPRLKKSSSAGLDARRYGNFRIPSGTISTSSRKM
jgi:hypothetical protein